MKKDISIILGLFLLIVVLMIFGKGFSSASLLTNNKQSTDSATVSAKQTSLIKVASGKLDINAEIAANLAARKKGLGKRDYIDIDNGMLFVFEQPGDYAIWMKDMKFAIDIIWIDENKMIVDIAENVPPQPGKSDKELVVYKPKGTSKYILEISAGLVKLNDLKIGDKVDFTL